MTDSDPLQSLLIEETSIARDELATTLRPLVQLTQEGALWPLDAFQSLSATKRLLCVLLALKAAEMLGLRDTASATPAELVDVSGMPAGTIRPKLSELSKQHFLSKTGREYALSPPGTRRAISLLGSGT